VNGAGFVRFFYGAPTASLLLILSLQITGAPLPEANWRFVAFCAAGGIAQILATNLLIMAFGYRNFAVGTAYGKTETVQSAVIAFIFLHEVLSGLAWIGIAIGLCGVMTLSLAGKGFKPRDLLAASVQPAALCGLGAGFILPSTLSSSKWRSTPCPARAWSCARCSGWLSQIRCKF
jgi:drug/metabolite transporter (DMT)-like permease